MPMLPRRTFCCGCRVFCFVVVATVVAGRLEAQERPYAVYVMKEDGSQARKLAQIDGYDNYDSPRWSPDGKQVLFNASMPNGGTSELFVINADGTGLRKLGEGYRPDWSPDGKQIAYDNGSEVFVQNLDGQGQQQPYQRAITALVARWQPDGRGRGPHAARARFGDRPAPRLCLNSRSSCSTAASAGPPTASSSPPWRTPAQGPRRQLLIVNAKGEEHGLRAQGGNQRRHEQLADLFARRQTDRLFGRVPDHGHRRRRQRAAAHAPRSEEPQLRTPLVPRRPMDRLHQQPAVAEECWQCERVLSIQRTLACASG